MVPFALVDVTFCLVANCCHALSITLFHGKQLFQGGFMTRRASLSLAFNHSMSLWYLCAWLTRLRRVQPVQPRGVQHSHVGHSSLKNVVSNLALHVSTIHDHHMTPPLKTSAILNDKIDHRLKRLHGSEQHVQSLKWRRLNSNSTIARVTTPSFWNVEVKNRPHSFLPTEHLRLAIGTSFLPCAGMSLLRR